MGILLALTYNKFGKETNKIYDIQSITTVILFCFIQSGNLLFLYLHYSFSDKIYRKLLNCFKIHKKIAKCFKRRANKLIIQQII